MPANYPGVNTVKAKLASGEVAVYRYHRATGIKLTGEPGTPEFVASLAAAQSRKPDRDAGTLAGLLRQFEGTAKWRRLAESTRGEYKRVLTFWADKYGTLPLRGVESKLFRQTVLKWHDAFSADHPREADNRVTVLARVLSWGSRDGPLSTNVLEGFDRAYESARSDIIWLPEHIEPFLEAATPEMRVAMMLALHTGQRQADIRRMAWSNYDGQRITIRQGKGRKTVSIPCTKALKAMLDGLPKRGAAILTTKTGRAFEKRYFARQWEAVYTRAKLPTAPGLHFHDIRGTTVTMLFEAGCNVAEAATITGHSLRRAQEILDKYLARTSVLADAAIAKFENRMEQERAKRPAKGHSENDAKYWRARNDSNVRPPDS